MLADAQKKKLLGAVDVLATATEGLDDFYAAQARLSVGMLRNAASAMCENLTASAVSDFDFALGDLRQLKTELAQSEADEFESVLLLIDATMAEAREQTQLSGSTSAAIRALRGKLADRTAAIDRQQYRTPGTDPDPLPHPPESLQAEAQEIQRALHDAGFATPELDRLIRGEGTFYLHDVRQLIEELDVIDS